MRRLSCEEGSGRLRSVGAKDDYGWHPRPRSATVCAGEEINVAPGPPGHLLP